MGLKETLETVFRVFYREYDDDEDCDCDDNDDGGGNKKRGLKETLSNDVRSFRVYNEFPESFVNINFRVNICD